MELYMYFAVGDQEFLNIIGNGATKIAAKFQVVIQLDSQNPPVLVSKFHTGDWGVP